MRFSFEWCSINLKITITTRIVINVNDFYKYIIRDWYKHQVSVCSNDGASGAVAYGANLKGKTM